MRRRRIVAALMLVGVGVLLGTTIFREEIAQAAQIVSAEITGPLDADGNVKVHEQGIADVRITNRAVQVTGTVDVNVTTRKVFETSPSGVGTSPGNSVPVGTIDTASLSQLRIDADLRSTGECVGGVFLVAKGPAGDVLFGNLTNGLSNPVIDLPGPELTLSLFQSDGFPACTADVTVWGR